jgi:tRNA threonylcarbamoyladenosine biosynthesis protein TsaB
MEPATAARTSMRILAIDTCSNVCSVCISDDDRIVAEYASVSDKTHTERLMPAIELLFSHLDAPISSVDGIAVIHGPGSFTGLRISLSVVKGLAFALQLPVVPASALEIAALQLPQHGLIAPALDARRNEIFTCLFEKTNADLSLIQEPRSISAVEWLRRLPDLPVVFCGPGAYLYWETLSRHAESNLAGSPDLILAPTLARFARAKLLRGEGISAGRLKAAYLRPSDAESKAKSGK